MHPEDDRPDSPRGTFLTFLLVGLTIAGGLVFFVALMGMFVFQALAIVGVIAGAGLCHYFLWGRTMSQEAALQRGEDEESDEGSGRWSSDGPHRPRF
jgi:hypothetical protein